MRQVFDMTTGLKYSEDYADPNVEVWAHAKAGSPLPKPKDYTGPYEFLQTVQQQGEHGVRSSTRPSTPMCWVGSSLE